MNEKIQELIDKLPDELKPYAEQYIPALEAMAEAEIIAFVTDIINGKTLPAYRILAKQMDDEALLAELDAIGDGLDAANEANAVAMEEQRKILLAIFTVAIGLLAKNLSLGA